jgi:pimeloyl-ACP methyl ester carboxylesterase
VRLGVRDWPGLGSPLVHVPDPLTRTPLVEDLASAMAPAHRVLSIAPRMGVPYQVAAFDLLGVLRQFGLERPVLIGESLGSLPVVLLAAWYPSCVGRVILLDPTLAASASDSPEARALRACPPDWPALRAHVRCDVLELRADDPALMSRVEAFLEAPLP